MDLDLTGKTAIVSGGTKGLGRAIVESLLREGVSVALCGRDEGALAVTLEETKEIGPSVFGMAGDVTNEEFLNEFVSASANALGGVDLAVANVGGMTGGQLANSTPDDWSLTYHMNVGHSVSLARQVLPYMQTRGGGSIVFIASISGWKPAPTLQYGAAKAGVIYAAQALGRHLARHKIRINAVSPGSILCEGGPWAEWRDEDPSGFAAFVEREFPNGRMGTVEEIADAVTFLLSSRASWISGTNVAVDGAQERPSASSW